MRPNTNASRPTYSMYGRPIAAVDTVRARKGPFLTQQECLGHTNQVVRLTPTVGQE